MAYRTADDIEAAFYRAFAMCDLESMQRLWAVDEATCAHPGGMPLVGYERVMSGWEHIFAGAAMPSLQFDVIRRITSKEFSVHFVEERIHTPGKRGAVAKVLATNVYRQRKDGWLMVFHQGVLMRDDGPAAKPTLQ